MTSSNFQNIGGLLVIFAMDPMWPHSANIVIIPDGKGFALIETGCGSISAFEYLLKGLYHFNLKLRDLHTIVLSHAHPDHMGAMGRILQEVQPQVRIHSVDVTSAKNPQCLTQAFDIPLAKKIWSSHKQFKQYKDFDLLVFFEEFGCNMSTVRDVKEMEEGDILRLGDFSFDVYHTPGHSPGHVSFYEKETRMLLPGDIVGLFPAWYCPSSGGVIGYLASLDKLQQIDAKPFNKTHGQAMTDLKSNIDKIRGKLMKRENDILEFLKKGPLSFTSLVQKLFPVPFMQFFPGTPILESHLIKLEQENVLSRDEKTIRLN